MPDLAAILLCGGASRRMGRSKADLPFGSETLLERAVRLLSAEAQPVIVSASAGQRLPDCVSRSTIIVRDDDDAHRGPLPALAKALEAVPAGIDRVYLSAVDAPFVSPSWMRHLLERIGDCDAAAAVVRGRIQPLAALYRVGPTRSQAQRLLAAGSGRLSSLLEGLRTYLMDDFQTADRRVFVDLDSPEDYRLAVAELVVKGAETPARGPSSEG